MTTRTQAKHPRIDHCFAVITTEVNGQEHSLLPANTLAPKLLSVEVALSKAILHLDASTAKSKAIEDMCFDAYDWVRSCTQRETTLPSGETQIWSSMPVHTSVNPAANKLFDGNMYGPLNDQVEYEITCRLHDYVFSKLMKPYIAAGKALLRAFRLLASAAPKSFESRTAFMKRQGLASDLETDGQGEFDKYLLSCRKVVDTRGFDSGFRATFNRFEAVWKRAPVEAKSAFNYAL